MASGKPYNYIRMMQCDVCGETYIRPAMPIYRIAYKGKTYKCCSYHCYRSIQKQKEGVDDESSSK